MKKLIIFIVAAMFIFAVQPVFASDSGNSVTKDYLNDGSYYETVIEDAPSATITPFSTNTKTKSKTTYYKNASGQVMWYVRVTGTFTYGNGTSKCTSVTPSAVSNVSPWKVSNISGSKSGSKASATATGKQYMGGRLIKTITKSVTLTCSSTGIFS